MKRIILTEAQLKEYVEIKKAEKIFYDIIIDMHKNRKFLNENLSIEKANQSVIDKYKVKNLITPKVYEMLLKYKIMGKNHQII